MTREISPMHDAREYDVVVSAGEQITVGLMAMHSKISVSMLGHGSAGRFRW